MADVMEHVVDVVRLSRLLLQQDSKSADLSTDPAVSSDSNSNRGSKT